MSDSLRDAKLLSCLEAVNDMVYVVRMLRDMGVIGAAQLKLTEFMLEKAASSVKSDMGLAVRDMPPIYLSKSGRN